MKKILISLVFLFCAVASFAYERIDTFPNTQSASNALTLFIYKGALKAAVGGITTNYPDTTTANTTPLSDYSGAIIFVNDTIWVRDVTKTRWITIQSAGGGTVINDTIYTRLPIYVDTLSNPGKRVIAFLQANGLISGGIVTVDSCMTIDVTAPVFLINYKQYQGAATFGVVITPAHPSLPRIDRVVMDTNLQVIVIPGTPSVTPISPPYNSFSQISLAEIPVGAGVTCLSATQEIIQDGVGDNAGQWTPTTAGTGSTNFVNTAAPYHLLQAGYTVTYTDGYQVIYTKPSGTDTVKPTSILKGFIMLIGGLSVGNQISAQWYNGTTVVSTPLLLNTTYFNPNDSNNYRMFVVPLNAWAWPGGSIFNKLILTFGGNDVSGAKGVYLDYIQLQTGIGTLAKQYVDSSRVIGNYLYDFYSGVGVRRDSIGGGGSGGTQTLQQTFDTEVGGSLLTKLDTILTTGVGIKIFGNNNVDPISINNTGGSSLRGTSPSNTAIIGISTTSTGVQGISTSQNGVTGNSVTGVAISAQQSAGLTNPAGEISKAAAATNTVTNVLRVTRSTGTAANGIGGSIEFYNEGVTLGNFLSNELISKWTNATTASRTSEFSITGVDNAVTQTQLSLLTGGQLQLPQYTTSNFNGGAAADSVLVVTSTGVVKKRNAASFSGGGGGGINIYNTDSSLAGDRTVDLNDKILSIKQGSNAFLRLDPTVGSETTELLAINNTGNGNRAQVTGTAGATEAQQYVKASFNDGDKTAQINLYADVAESEIQYIAEKHIFPLLDSTASPYNIVTLDHDTLKVASLSSTTPEALDLTLRIGNRTRQQYLFVDSVSGASGSGATSFQLFPQNYLTNYGTNIGTSGSFSQGYSYFPAVNADGRPNVVAKIFGYNGGDGASTIAGEPSAGVRFETHFQVGSEVLIEAHGITPEIVTRNGQTRRLGSVYSDDSTGVSSYALKMDQTVFYQGNTDTTNLAMSAGNMEFGLNTNGHFVFKNERIPANLLDINIGNGGTVFNNGGTPASDAAFTFNSTIQVLTNSSIGGPYFNTAIYALVNSANYSAFRVANGAGGSANLKGLYALPATTGTFMAIESLNLSTGTNIARIGGNGGTMAYQLYDYGAGRIWNMSYLGTTPEYSLRIGLETDSNLIIRGSTGNTKIKYNLGVGNIDATSTLSVNGSFGAAYVAKTGTYTATISDYTIDCTANTFTVTLPTAVGIAGRIYNIVNSGAGTITLATTSSQTFANVVATPTTLTVATLVTVIVQSNGANWNQLK